MISLIILLTAIAERFCSSIVCALIMGWVRISQMTKKNDDEKAVQPIESIDVRFKGIVKKGLQEEEALCKVSNSEFTRKNIKVAKTFIEEFSLKLNLQDPKSATPGTSKFLMNLMYSYCYMGAPKALSDDTMEGLIQGLRKVNSQHGHRGT